MIISEAVIIWWTLIISWTFADDVDRLPPHGGHQCRAKGSNLFIAVNVTDSAWAPENRQDALLQLFEELRSAVLGNPPA